LQVPGQSFVLRNRLRLCNSSSPNWIPDYIEKYITFATLVFRLFDGSSPESFSGTDAFSGPDAFSGTDAVFRPDAVCSPDAFFRLDAICVQ
jgi:hypothetical protein